MPKPTHDNGCMTWEQLFLRIRQSGKQQNGVDQRNPKIGNREILS